MIHNFKKNFKSFIKKNLKKKYIFKNTIIIGNSNKLLNIFNEKISKNSFILINKNIIELEKEKKLKDKIIIYPIDTTHIDDKQIIFYNMLEKKLKNINSIIIYTTEPTYAEPFEKISIKKWNQIFYENIYTTINILNNITNSSQEKKIIITIIIHREKVRKNNFLYTNKCINNILINLMDIMKNNAIINCISTENLTQEYKEKIYPYKKKSNLKKIEDIKNAYETILSKKLNKKIIIV